MTKRTESFYHNLLKCSQDIMNHLSNEINMRGTGPTPDEQADFEISARVIGMIFDNLVNMGYEIKKGPAEGLYEAVINGETFICHKDAMTVTPVIKEQPQPVAFGWGNFGGTNTNTMNAPVNTMPEQHVAASMPEPQRQAPMQQTPPMRPQMPSPMAQQVRQGMPPVRPQMQPKAPETFAEASENIKVGNYNGMPTYGRQMDTVPEYQGQETDPYENVGIDSGYGEEYQSEIPNNPMPNVKSLPKRNVNTVSNMPDEMEGLAPKSFRGPGSTGYGEVNTRDERGYTGDGRNSGNEGFGGNRTGYQGYSAGYGEAQKNDIYGETGTQEEVNYGPEIMSVGREPSARPAQNNEQFPEEKQKSPYEFVFDTMRVTLTHKNTAGSPEEMHIMVAPLVMTRKPQPSVPIVVAFYHKAGFTIRSSYDDLEEGKNLVIVDVGDYNLLCRGSIDNNGNFVSSITTTGHSAQMGDIFTVVDKKTYGRQAPNPGNGHIKFTHNDYVIEVFPFDVDFNDYVVIAKGPEFTDNLCASKKTQSRALIWGGDANFEVLVNKNETAGMIEAEIDEQS